MNKGVIVLGGHVQGYGIVKIYGENKIPSVVVDTTNNCIARHSKYCVKFIKVDYNQLLSKLSELAKDASFINWLLLPTDDYYVRILSQNKEALSKYFKVSVDDWAVIENFFNKRLTYPLAAKLDIPIPGTFFPDTIEDLKKLSSQITFPCIIKPAVMLDFYRHFKKKVFVCNNQNDLIANYGKALSILKSDEIILQEIIPGNSENQYSVGVFSIAGKIINSLVARRKRQHPIDFGIATTFAETINVLELEQFAEKIINKVKYTGVCEIEFKYDARDSKYKFLEVNPRTWKWHLISEGAGIPFLLSLYNHFTQKETIIKKDFIKCNWQDIITDLPVKFKLVLKAGYIRANKKSKTVQAVYDKKDIKPFLMQLLYLPYNIIRR